jgi:hypothetical protein
LTAAGQSTTSSHPLTYVREGIMSADPYRSTPASPEPDAAAIPPRRTIRFYQHGDVAVTNYNFHRGGERYAIADLSDLRLARGALHPGVSISLVIALVQAPLAALVVAVVRTPLAYLLAVAALVIPGIVALVCARRFPPRQQVLARYRGAELTLFASSDEREFGQVVRAVRRALEARDLLL